MKERLKAIGWGFGGALAALVIWLAAATVYQDHVLLQQVVSALNQAATRQAQAQAAPAK